MNKWLNPRYVNEENKVIGAAIELLYLEVEIQSKVNNDLKNKGCNGDLNTTSILHQVFKKGHSEADAAKVKPHTL